MNKYADLEFLSLADRIASDYKSLLEKISGLDDSQDSPINLLAFRVLVEIHQDPQHRTFATVSSCKYCCSWFVCAWSWFRWKPCSWKSIAWTAC